MPKQKIYTHKINEDASSLMRRILLYPRHLIELEVNGKMCRITCDYAIEKNVNAHFLKENPYEKLYQVEVLGVEGREFLFVGSMLQMVFIKDQIIINSI